ncbi:MAG TPA: pyruvate kinase [Candidatus Saccharimonadales bacterium]|nr:pyruvate kinase [Candidatus Saccharimonadales bacterium]
MKVTSIDEFKKTKIVATIGPASESEEKLRELIDAGLNVARLNFSHGTQDDHKERLQKIRKLSLEMEKPVAILQDLQGPKIRLGNLKKDNILKKGESVTLCHGDNQITGDIPVQIDIFPHLKTGDPILINDGIIRLEVKELPGKSAVCTVVAGGEIKSHKGVNLPNTQLPSMALTEKDKSDLAFGLENEVDYVAVSFVQSEEDILYVKKLMQQHVHQPKIVAKIECGPAVRNLHKIIDASDAVMVARGDLAVEVGQEEVPILQRSIITYAKRTHKPVIVATQMLESMIHNAEPTRAEVNDVATAVLDGVDAVMLSAESASGDYPVESVAMMKRIIKRVERFLHESREEHEFHPHGDHSQIDAIAESASLLSLKLGAKAILCLTQSGVTAQELSSYRPSVPIFVLTDNKYTYQWLALLWGVKCFLVDKITDNSNSYGKIVKKLQDMDVLHSGDRVVEVAGTHPGVSGHINSITVYTCE